MRSTYDPSPGRPLQRTPAEDVQMQMIDSLPCIVTTVEDGTIPSAETFLGGHFFSYDEQVANERLIRRLYVVQAWDRLARNHEQVGRRLGINITECKAAVVLVDNIRINLPIRNLLKERLVGHRG